MAARKSVRNKERAEAMASMYRQGVILADIGEKFGITRERVRQILSVLGIVGKDGGARARTAMKNRSAEQAKIARVQARWGVDYALWLELRAAKITAAYACHKKNAGQRAIPFLLTFPEWLSVWQASGKLHLRGKGIGKYCMSRLSDSGAYELGNVHVQPCQENSREAVKKWAGKEKAERGVYCLYPGRELAWLAKCGKVSLGYFATEAEAAAARSKYMASKGLHPKAPGLGTGRGWTIKNTMVSRPYQVQVTGTKCSYHATEEEARAEYLRRCAEVASQRPRRPAKAEV